MLSEVLKTADLLVVVAVYAGDTVRTEQPHTPALRVQTKEGLRQLMLPALLMLYRVVVNHLRYLSHRLFSYCRHF